ncbi:MAG: gliding motility-associated C-terminal domain-containing protein [Bacteroidetes bacterium]|nr:gliding motility-associated C-terminal domain-containing protein [Bacteroidota bacterium]MBS1973972.1 gliding motility-associated C-terminal domain-containing protein [Bacteroidota bacterium]
MIRILMKIWLLILGAFSLTDATGQSQACPANINFSNRTLTHWLAYTGNNANGNGPSAIKQTYDSNQTAPFGTIGATAIPEYQLSSVTGIQVVTQRSSDYFGGFPTIPTINGYSYNYSVLIGSTAISTRNSNTKGGFIRGVKYKFFVPASATSQPYTMTYAYAMVLENGTHPSNNQPMISATISTNDSVIRCASPSYYLPTLNNGNNGVGAILDSAAAKANGFSVSRQLSPHPDPDSQDPNAPHLQDVWYKPWTEVTFDLSAYRGQEVTLTFEADNCVPGGHFSYGYIAIRNTCAGLIISGDSIACINGNTNYSIPTLAGASYSWSVPGDWVINSGRNSNIINVTVGTQNGFIIANEQNGCAYLRDTLRVSTIQPTIPGNVTADATVCTGINSTQLTLSGNRGNIIAWVSSANGANWSNISNTSANYTAQNLSATTTFRALVQNGYSCSVDTSTAAIVTVDPKSVGGSLAPPSMDYCAGQNVNALLVLSGKLGNVVDWQYSTDSTNWMNFAPAKTDTSNNVNSISATTYYRVIVKDGVCPEDTSSVATLNYFSTPFPQARISPEDTTICYGYTAPLNALVSIGTNYSWANDDSLSGKGNGIIASTPSLVTATAHPSATADYILNFQNTGCPNTLADTFHVKVIPKITVFVVSDTAVVINEPLHFNATSSERAGDVFLWTPPTFLNDATIPNPTGIYPAEINAITYIVRATDSIGCYGEAPVKVRVFTTLPDIFVPSAFTPGKTTNNIFRPIPVGIANFQFFRVYNRWGQLVYGTSQTGTGWNGNYNGKPQDAGTFVWMAQGIDYTGRKIFRKGTVVLMR